QILNRVRDVDASDSEAVKEALNAFFQNLLKYKDIDCNRWLRALLNVINRYCGTHRPTIESYLTHFLTSNNFFNVIEAAKCAHAVQQPIQPQLILAVILQALSAPGSEDSANVTAIKIQALRTLDALQFQELLVRECFALHDHASARAMCVLRALEACRTSGSLKVPPPTQYCLQLYSDLVNSPQREVSKFCSQALMDIRLHLHCSPASLSFSLGEQSQKQKDKEEGRKRVSERNRVVLEKLLGID
ncbi:Proline-, glutamic acid-and leucine-rich protein 1, partial [Operophtera brumata]